MVDNYAIIGSRVNGAIVVTCSKKVHWQIDLKGRLIMSVFRPAVQVSQTSHFSAGMAWRKNPKATKRDRALEFLVIEYAFVNSRPYIKFPGGTNKSNPTEVDPIDTLRREWKEEVGEELTGVCDPPHMVKDQGHTKYFRLIDPEQRVGNMRTVVKVEQEVGRPDEHLGPPRWVAAVDLLRYCGPLEIFRNHRSALEAAVKILDPRLL